MWQTQTSKLPQQQLKKKKEYVADKNVQTTTVGNQMEERICGRRKRPNYHSIKFPEFGNCVRVGGPNVTADSNPNNWFKLMPVLGPSCLPLIKQDSNFRKDCIFYWCEIALLDRYVLTLRISIFKSSSNWTILVILVPSWLKSVFGARLWRIEHFNLKLMINRSLALFKTQVVKR